MLKNKKSNIVEDNSETFEVPGWEGATIGPPRKIEPEKNLPDDIANIINKMSEDYGIEINQKHIDLEFDIEKTYKKDSKSVNREALQSIKKLIAAAKKEFPKILSGLGLVSGYRSYESQARNFGSKAQRRGVDNVQKSNALPGFSDHHTGKAFDIFSVENSWWNSRPELKLWVAENSKRFGFIQTYKGDTARIEEPWHLYYTGSGKNESINVKNLDISQLKNLILKEILDSI